MISTGFFVLASPVADAIARLRPTFVKCKKEVEKEVNRADREFDQNKHDPSYEYDLDEVYVRDVLEDTFDELEEIIDQSITPFIQDLELHRKDERRKLNNLVNKVNGFEEFLDREPDHTFNNLDQWEDPTTPIRWLLENTEKYIMSIYRLRSRVDRYYDIPKEFELEGFNIINQYGYSQEEIHKSLSSLSRVASLLRDKGLDDLLYGDVALVRIGTAKKIEWSALYSPEYDFIIVQVGVDYRFNQIYTYIHELGHRYWHKFLSASQRAFYYDGFRLDALWVSLEEREKMWEALEKANYWPPKAAKLLSEPELQAELKARFKSVLKKEGLIIRMVRQSDYWRGVVKEHFVDPYAQDLKPKRDIKPYSSVTPYARTNVDEDFAEVFAHYVMGRKMPKNQEMRILELVP